MSYLYGDLTPFPEDSNFIDVIRDATELCRAILQSEAVIERARDQGEADKISVARSVQELHQLSAALEETLRPFLSKEGMVQDVSGRVLQSLRGIVDATQSSLQSRYDASQAQVESRMAAERMQVLPILEKFLVRHELPQTEWRVRWMSSAVESQVSEAKAWATARCGLEATFEIEVPPSSPWFRMVRIGDVRQNVSLGLPKKARHGTVLKKQELDRFFITEVALSRELVRLILRKAARGVSMGVELIWRGDALSVSPLDDDSLAPGSFVPDPEDAMTASGLRQVVEAHLWSLLDRRVRLTEAKLGQVDVQHLETPALVARAVIASIAPYCREIIARSSVPGELSLKRVVEDGRREEIFIRASELSKSFASLPLKQRSYFDELGLPSLSAEMLYQSNRETRPTGPVRPLPAEWTDDPLGGVQTVRRLTGLLSEPEVIVDLPPAPRRDDDDNDHEK